jgi:hypothetical protein
MAANAGSGACLKSAPMDNPARGFCERDVSSNTKPLRGTMSEIREDHSASRVSTYFVFIVLVAAIIEPALASLVK